MEKKVLNEQIKLSDGNTKLISTEFAKYLIWNLRAKLTCPYSTIMCRDFCYAFKAEVQYKESCTNSRDRHFMESEKENFVSDMISWISYNLNRRTWKKDGVKVYFRIHESGDFYNQAYFDKWVSITQAFKNNENIVFLAYTKSIKFVEETKLEIPDSFVIRYSVWDDTAKEEIQLQQSLNLPIFTAFNKEDIQEKVNNEGYTFCDCKCENCKKCYSLEDMKIAVEKH